MKRQNPSHRIEKITVLAEDPIKPYGDRFDVSSESKRRQTELELWGINKDESGSEKSKS